MNYDNSGHVGYSRRRVSPSIPTGNFSQQRNAPTSDLPPSERITYPSPASNSSNNSKSWGLNNYPLAMVYSPVQEFKRLFDEDTALSRGTLFADLYLPFEGQDCIIGGRC